MKNLDKQEIKKAIAQRIHKVIDDAEKIGSLNFFEIEIKSINGEIVTKLKNSYKDKI